VAPINARTNKNRTTGALTRGVDSVKAGGKPKRPIIDLRKKLA
jgi:hypothetical protein